MPIAAPTRRFLLDAAERAGKTFAQAYFGLWLLRAGLGDAELAEPRAAAFDLLFTLDNVKAGVVGVALSVATSIGSRQIGRRDDASLVTP
jgi:hypothetical protein